MSMRSEARSWQAACLRPPLSPSMVRQSLHLTGLTLHLLGMFNEHNFQLSDPSPTTGLITPVGRLLLVVFI